MWVHSDMQYMLYHWGIHTTSGSVDASIFFHRHNILGTCIIGLCHDFLLMLDTAKKDLDSQS